MDIKKLQRAIVDGLEDVKAQHILVFNTEHLSSLFERVIIASGTSNRQTKALAASVRNSVKARGMPVMSTEGEDNGEWIIVDCGAAVAHIMQPAIREYYHLEEIWGGKNVRMKVGPVNTKLVKASEPDAPSGRSARPVPSAAPAKKRAAAQPGAAGGATQKPASPRPTSKTEADRKMANRTAAFKRVASKTPARKSTGAATQGQAAPVRKSAAAAAPAKAAPARRSAGAAAPAKAAPARKAAPRKTPKRA